ncbi:MAG: hypothetical protein QS748_09335 [Candidatus Endonucleobacter bathymodioli]|uniref:SPOR domain-containing protein n=1 Tax=Candidatus Endonucleibacter bathymodioli TaxID=539814 RepID=A0AA90ST85_9GAMM|nr:hypothetical protein [Candidatus Endonucleobacter bathymodioli]
MSGRATFKDKQLRLCVATTLAAGSAVSTVEALFLPPEPLSFSSSWDCRSDSFNRNERLCHSKAVVGYSNSVDYGEQASRNNVVAESYGYSPVAEEDFYESIGRHQVLYEQPVFNPAVADSAILLELLNAPPGSYVLQWQAEHSRKPLERLKAQYLVFRDSTIAQYQRAGKQWFILLDGPYPSRIAAMAALRVGDRAALASRFRPWTRSVSSIQNLDLIRPEQNNHESVASSETSIAARGNTSGSYSNNEYKTMTSDRQSFIPSQQIPISRQGAENRYNDILGSDYNSHVNQPGLINRQYSSNGSTQQYHNYGNQLQPNVSQQQASMLDYSDGYSYAGAPVSNFQGANSPTTPDYRYTYQEGRTIGNQSSQQDYRRSLRLRYDNQTQSNVSRQKSSARGYSDDYSYMETPVGNFQGADRYTYQEGHAIGNQSRQQDDSRALSPFQDSYREGYKQSSKKRYYDNLSPETVYSQQRQATDPVYTQTSTYNNDLRYAMASIGNQSMLPPKPKPKPKPRSRSKSSQRPDYSNNHNQDFRQGSARQQTDYNMPQSTYSDYGYNPDSYREAPESAPRNRRSNPYSSAVRPEELSLEYGQTSNEIILNAPMDSYTIQWISASKKASIERIQLRYPALQNARIIHYRKNNEDWYLLVGGTFISRQAAQAALELPPYSRLTARLYPWVRPVKVLQEMITAAKDRGESGRRIVKKATPLQKIISTVERGYTIQWYAANKPEAIKKMQKRFPELSNAVTVHFKRNHKDWYVLLQGQFSSSTDAISTIKSAKMSDAARFLHPWTRPVNTLRNLDIQGQG